MQFSYAFIMHYVPILFGSESIISSPQCDVIRPINCTATNKFKANNLIKTTGAPRLFQDIKGTLKFAIPNLTLNLLICDKRFRPSCYHC